jgi:hypothetical protein
MRLQANMANAISGVGGLDFLAYRGFSTSTNGPGTEPLRFVDGNFIELFLEQPEDIAEAIVKGNGKAVDELGVSVEKLRAMMETLRRLH